MSRHGTNPDPPMMFVSDRMVTSLFGAVAPLFAIGAALAAGAALAVGLAVGGHPVGVVALIAAGLALCTLPGPSEPLQFFRRYECAASWVKPPATTGQSELRLAIGTACGILVLIPSSAVAMLLIYAAAGLALRHWLDRPIRWCDAYQRFGRVLHVFLGYPDGTYTSPVGLSGVWLPHERLDARNGWLGRRIIGLYLIGSGGWLLWERWLSLGLVHGLVSAVMLLPLPYCLVFTGQIRTVEAYFADRQAIAVPESDWESAVRIVQQTEAVCDGHRLSEHYFLGWYLSADETAPHPFRVLGERKFPGRIPALLHRDILNGHGHVLGSSQSGKSSLGVCGLVMQEIRGWETVRRTPDGLDARDRRGRRIRAAAEPKPMLIIDLKHDMALYETTRLECERAGRRFRHFTLTTGDATAFFNPIANLGIADRKVIEFCELLMNALSLFHGHSYGRSYFSKQTRSLLLSTLLEAPRPPQTWEEVYKLLLAALDPRKHRDVFELTSSIFALAQYEVLGPAPNGIDEIHMPRAIAEREVIYFNLPARLSAVSARDVGKLALFAFVTAAADWNDRNPERRCIVFLDEAQIICSSNLATLFQQCSGASTSIVLSNQARSDLNTPDAPNLSDTVRVNTRFKQMFTVVDPRDARELIASSGERSGWLETYSRTDVSYHQTVTPVLNQNDINQVNNDRNGSLIQVTMDGGLSALGGVPRHIQTPYPLSEAEYRKRLHTPWPRTPTPMAGATERQVIVRQSPEDVQASAEAQHAELMEFFERTARRAGRHRFSDWSDPSG